MAESFTLYGWCPYCGEELPHDKVGEGQWCDGCQRYIYRNAAPTATAIILKNKNFRDYVLLTKRAREPKKGLWDLPGGFCGPLESPYDTVRREVKEELGIDNLLIMGVAKMEPHLYGDIPVLSISFSCRVAERFHGEFPNPADDVEEARWFNVKNLDDVEFGWPHDLHAIINAL